MSRYRLFPSPAQEAVLRDHCAHARYVWNLAVEQHAHWRVGRKTAPGYLEQCTQLTQARAEYPWLAAGSQTVQQQALRDFTQAMTAFFDRQNPAGRPRWRKALSTGALLMAPGLVTREQKRLRRLERRLARAKRCSNRRRRVKQALARLRARETDRRKDWVEKTSTDIARRFDVIRVEDLQIKNMTRSAKGTRENPGRNVRQKCGLNRGILRSGWGLLVRRLEDKAPGRVERINPAYTSQTCSGCGHRDPESRESQSRFRCRACGLQVHADVNAARNIAAGHAVTARGGDGVARPANREPQLLLQPA
jgi:Putative transposase DNA-binding domain/Probable transposase/Helix-turn-helix domain